MLTLHLHVSPADGWMLWAAQPSERFPDRSVSVPDFAVLEDADHPLAEALLDLLGGSTRTRHRLQLHGGVRLAARLLSSSDAATLCSDVRRELLAPAGVAPDGEDGVAVLMRLAGRNRVVPVTEGLALAPDVVALAALWITGRRLVEQRRILPRLAVAFEDKRLEWTAVTGAARTEVELVTRALPELDLPSGTVPPAVEALDRVVDHHGRRAFAAHLLELPAIRMDSTADTLGADVIGSLSARSPLDASIALESGQVREVQHAFEAFAASGIAGVEDEMFGGSQLVLRLGEPPPSRTRGGSQGRPLLRLEASWPLATCLREESGLVHPLAELTTAGDLDVPDADSLLARVLRAAPALATEKTDAAGYGWLLSSAGASDFLGRTVPLLEAAGITVLLPREWTTHKAGLHLRRQDPSDEDTDASRRSSGVGLNAMAEFDWRVAIGDLEITEQEMQRILLEQSELVELRGQWVRLDAATLRAASDFLRRFSREPRGREAGTDAGAGTVSDPDAGTMSGPGAPASRRGPSRTQPDRPRSDDRWDHDFWEVTTGDGSHGTRDEQDFAHEVIASARQDTTIADMFSFLIKGDLPPLAIQDLTEGGLLGPIEPAPHPRTLYARLRPYQLEGLAWMRHLESLGLGGILADDMGLGKTMQVLALMLSEREEAGRTPASRIGPTLLVCPMSVLGSWQREAATFAPDLVVHVHHGAERTHGEEFEAAAYGADLVLTTYALLARDLGDLQRLDWRRVVLDEAQHVKNANTAVSQASRRLTASRRLALTGTPVENRLRDLRTILEFTDPGLMPSPTQFKEHISDPIEQERDERALAQLHAITDPLVLRRLKSDKDVIADLPEKIERTLPVPLTAEQAGLYDAVVQEMLEELERPDDDKAKKDGKDKKKGAIVVSALTRLKQICNHPAHYLGDGSPLLRDGAHRSGKLEAVDDLLAQALDAGEKVLLFTQFRQFGDLVVPHWRRLFGDEVPFLHGGVPKAERDEMVARFQEPAGPRLMTLSLRAGGTGLTLTAASQVIHLDRWWNPAVENQATDRAYRIGQGQRVLVHKLVAEGTIEERIDAVINGKQEIADLTLARGEDWIGDLDLDAIVDLFRRDMAP